MRGLRINLLSLGVSWGLLSCLSLGDAEEQLIGFILWNIIFEDALERERVVLDGDAAGPLTLAVLEEPFINHVHASILWSG